MVFLYPWNVVNSGFIGRGLLMISWCSSWWWVTFIKCAYQKPWSITWQIDERIHSWIQRNNILCSLVHQCCSRTNSFTIKLRKKRAGLVTKHPGEYTLSEQWGSAMHQCKCQKIWNRPYLPHITIPWPYVYPLNIRNTLSRNYRTMSLLWLSRCHNYGR